MILQYFFRRVKNDQARFLIIMNSSVIFIITLTLLIRLNPSEAFFNSHRTASTFVLGRHAPHFLPVARKSTSGISNRASLNRAIIATADTVKTRCTFLKSSTNADVETSTDSDHIVNLKPSALARLRELKAKQGTDCVILRIGVRSGGCSGLSYVMDFTEESNINEDDQIDEHEDGIRVIVDPKSMLYLFGMDLDYSDELIGGGFQFHNPNAESSCGCGKSFGV